jgi:hypothetical protein
MTTISAPTHHQWHRHAIPATSKSTVRSPFLPALLVLVFFVGIFCHRDFVEEAAALQGQQSHQEKAIQLDPKRLYVDKVELFVQKPRTVEGVVLLFHGCNHDGIDWFQLPEDRKIVRYLLEQNLATIAISSENRQHRCWDSTFPANQNADAMRIKSVLPKVLQEHIGGAAHNDNLPLYAIGASSGGVFSSILCQIFPFLGISVIVAPGHTDAWEWMASNNSNKGQSTTAVAFVYMPKDTRFAGAIQVMQAQEQIKQRHPTKMFICEPKPVEASWIHEDIPSIPLEKAQSIMAKLSKPPLSVIDTQTHKLTKDPRGIWKSIVKTTLDGLEEVEVSSVQELLNVAWASHEMTSEHLPKVVQFWKESHTTS